MSAWVAIPCACAGVRRLARLTTRLYDAALRPHGIEIGQLTLLAGLFHAGPASPGQLSERFGMEPSSLTRSVALLERRGWIAKVSGADRRRRVLSITAAGRQQFKRTMPAWRSAQAHLQSVLGDTRSTQFAAVMDDVSRTLLAHTAKTTRSASPVPKHGSSSPRRRKAAPSGSRAGKPANRPR